VQPIAQNGYSSFQVIDALQKSGRTMRYQYERLNTRNESLGWITDQIVEGSGEVTHEYLREVQRTLRVEFVEGVGEITFDFYNDRIRPWVGVKMQDGGWVDWPQGVFLMSTPTRSYRNGVVTRSSDGYDQNIVLIDEVFAFRADVAAGALYTTAVSSHLSAIPNVTIAPSTLTLPAARTWDPGGVTKYEVVTDLVEAMNYGKLWFDGSGVGQLEPYIDPQDSPVGFTYKTDDQSVMHPEMDQTLDLFKVPNRIVFVVSKPDRPLLISEFVNNSPDSPISIVRRGRTVTQVDTAKDAATQVELDGLCRRAAINASNVYETVEFSTMLMPFHENRDTLQIEHDGLGVTGLYSEVGWSMNLQAGGRMSHKVRKIVNVNAIVVGVPDD